MSQVNIATLTATLTANTTQFQAAMRGAQAESTAVSGKLKGLGSTAKAVGVAAIGSALVKGVTSSIAAFQEAERVTAQTNAVLKSTGGAANVTAKQVQSLASQISGYSGIDDEAVQSGENLLLTFTRIRNEAGKGNNVFSQATRIMADLSVAMGQDMKSSAIQVGKALNDPVRGLTALQRIGVSFTEGQKAQIKALMGVGASTMSVSDAQAGLSKAQDAAAAAANRLRNAQDGVTTAQDRAKAAQEKVREAHGKVREAQDALTAAERTAKASRDALTDAYRRGRQELEDLNDAAKDATLRQTRAQLSLESAQQRLAKVNADGTATELDKREALQDVLEAQRGVEEANQMAARAQQAANDANAKGLKGANAVVGAQKDLDAANRSVLEKEKALTDARKDATKAQDAIAGALRGVEKAQRALTMAQAKNTDAAAASEKAQRSLSDAQGATGKATVTTTNRLKAQKIILKELEKEFGGSAKAAGETTTGAMNKLKVEVGNLQEELGKFLAPALLTVAGLLTSFVRGLREGTGVAGALIDIIKAYFTPLVYFGELLGKATYQLYVWGDAFASAASSVATAVSGVVSGVATTINGVVVAFVELPSKIVEAIKGRAEDLLEVGKWMVNRVAEGIKTVTDALGSVGGWIKNRVSDGLIAYKDALVGVGTSVMNWLVDGLKSVASVGADVAGFLRDKLAAIPGLIAEAVKAAGATIGGFIVSGIVGALDVGKRVANAVIDALNEAFKFINKKLPNKIKMPGPIPDINLPDNPLPEIPRFAEGVRNFGGGLALVGERGPELVNLPGGSDVIPNRPAAAMMGGGGNSYSIAVSALDPQAAASAVVRAIQEFERRNGAAWRAA